MAIDIQWCKKFGVGHTDVDREHQLFLDLIRNVSEALDRQEPKDWCLRLLREVEKYVDFHFFSEENLMLKSGYPEYLEHQKKHAEFLVSLSERVQAYASDRINLEAVVVFLFDWFVMHSAQMDKKLGKFLKEQP
ncbi:MAG: bacteriohemerythrin [Methylomonas sp.]|nr:bacteriohemerythrin [Methylomonas sp.]